MTSTMRLEVTITSNPETQTHLVEIQSKTTTGWAVPTTKTVTSDGDAANAVRAAVMDLIADSFWEAGR